MNSLERAPQEQGPNSLTPSRTAATENIQDVLASILSAIRVTGSLQFSFMAAGPWQADAGPFVKGLVSSPGTTMPFHIIVEGRCWLKVDCEEVVVEAGDIVAFPFCTSHLIGVGDGGETLDPAFDLPERPWQQIPVLRYGDERPETRILCGFLQCDVLDFEPLRKSLPKLIHIGTRTADDAPWLKATIHQMVAEVDSPRLGGVSMVPRLTEIMFVEILRNQIAQCEPQTTGWLAALADARISRCLSLIHADSRRDWSLEELALAAQTSRTALSERFQTLLDTSPMKYLRNWRLHLAGVALATTQQPIAAIAFESGYGTEAAFTRAFKRSFGHPPAAWRQMQTKGP